MWRIKMGALHERTHSSFLNLTSAKVSSKYTEICQNSKSIDVSKKLQ